MEQDQLDLKIYGGMTMTSLAITLLSLTVIGMYDIAERRNKKAADAGTSTADK